MLWQKPHTYDCLVVPTNESGIKKIAKAGSTVGAQGLVHAVGSALA